MPMFDRRVLVVDDDSLARFSTVALLEDAGYEVAEAVSAASALSALEGGLEVAAVVSDVAMPGRQNGVDLALEIRHRWPQLGILLMSGMPLGAAPPRGVEFLGKPFTQEQLTTALASLIKPQH